MEKIWTNNSNRILEQATSLNQYNRWIFSIFKPYFGKNILEVGSGLGGLSRYLPVSNTTLSDVRDDYLNHLKNRFGSKTIKLDIEKEAPKDLVDSFDTILSSNVLEHIKYDKKVLENCLKLLQKKGKLLLFVPAEPEIYGSLDKAMGHYRRYTKEDLANKAMDAGYKIIKIKYVNVIGYFSWWLRGKLPSKSNSDNETAKIFDTLVVPFLYLEKYLPVPFGQSLMLVAQKP